MMGSIKISIPVAQPDRNGRVFTEEAARKMAKDLQSVPVSFDGHICGMITDVFEPEVDEYGDVVIPVGVWFPRAGAEVSVESDRILSVALE